MGMFAVSDKWNDYGVPEDIVITRLGDNSADIPESHRGLISKVQSTLSSLQLIYQDRELDYLNYFKQLLSFARLGLVGDNPQPDFAIKLIENMKSEVVAGESYRAKNKYMRKLGVWAVVLAGASALLGLAVWAWSVRWAAGNFAAASFFYVWSGSMVGVWISFGVRKVTLTFEELHSPEKDQMEPMIRLFFAGSLSVIIALAFFMKMLDITVGEFSVIQFSENIYASLLVGLLLGVGEIALPKRVVSHASTIVSGDKVGG